MHVFLNPQVHSWGSWLSSFSLTCIRILKDALTLIGDTYISQWLFQHVSIISNTNTKETGTMNHQEVPLRADEGFIMLKTNVVDRTKAL